MLCPLTVRASFMALLRRFKTGGTHSRSRIVGRNAQAVCGIGLAQSGGTNAALMPQNSATASPLAAASLRSLIHREFDSENENAATQEQDMTTEAKMPVHTG